MSRYKRFKVNRVSDYSLESRSSKVRLEDFARPFPGGDFSDFLDSLPDILAARDLRLLAEKISLGRHRKKALIWGFGGHLIKVGLAPLLIDLMKRGFVTALATNGSGVIHDSEIALCGGTSEEVERKLSDGSFGMARETAELINQAIRSGAENEKGIGESVGEAMDRLEPRYSDSSLLLQAYRLRIPVSVHVGIGTDTIHIHPSASGAALGKGSLIDFQILAHQVARLNQGGVYLNVGSAVLLPEVFLKAVSLIRNSGRTLKDFTTANLDFIQHYRPRQNVVRRPVAEGGTGIAVTGHHEILIPLLAAILVVEHDSG